MAIVVGLHELLDADADSLDRLPERERRLISTADFPEDLPDWQPRRGRLLGEDLLGVMQQPRTVHELVDALEDVGVKANYQAVYAAIACWPRTVWLFA